MSSVLLVEIGERTWVKESSISARRAARAICATALGNVSKWRAASGAE